VTDASDTHSGRPAAAFRLRATLSITFEQALALDEDDRPQARVGSIAREAVLLPDTLPLPGVLERLRTSREELACVVDEYGGLAGVITTEDVAEELVGEIADAHDPEQEGEVRETSEGAWRLPGSTHIDEVERIIAHDLPPGEYQTLAGLIISELRRLPQPGETVHLELPEAGGGPPRRAELVVESVDRHVPEWVGLTLAGPAEAPAGDERGIRA
jgi:CBS domain containing-hemolysin-like protein